MPETFDYSTPGSENVTLLNALINDETPYTEDTHSRNAEILKSIINNTEYTDAPQSEIEELLLELKEKIGGEVEIDELNVTENGTYSETGKAYSPVNVNVHPELITKTITANGTYNASSDDADGYSSVTVAVEGYAKKSIPNTPTAIATFNASALPMPSLTVGIEATQDLHGYDNPWPAGGGKNKLQVTATTTTKDGVIFTVKKDGTIVVTGTKSSSASTRIWFDIAFNISFSENVILNGCPSGGSNTTYKLTGFLGSSGQGDYDDTGSGVAIPANTTLNTITIGIAQQGNISLVFKPMIRLATVSDATFAPYENKCPITGKSAVNVYDTGINEWDEEWEVGTYNLQNGEKEAYANYFRSKNFIPLHPNTEYRAVTSNQQIYILFYDMNHNYISYRGGGTFTTPINAYYMNFVITTTNSYNPNENPISINYPSTDTSYHAYNGTTYTIDLDGTRYGCTLDVVSGVLTIDRAYVDLGSLNYSLSSSISVFYSTITNMKAPSTSADRKNGIISSMFPVSNSTSISASMDDKSMLRDAGAIYVRDTDYNDVTAFKTAMSGVQLVYELATPQTIQLTPTAVKSLLGVNNIWCDSGDVQSGEYLEAL